MKKELTHDTQIDIRFSEMDPLGVVWHGNFFKFFEDGREALAQHFHFDYMALYELGIIVPVVSCTAEFKSSVYYRNRLRIVTRLIATPAAKLIHEYDVFNITTGKLSAKGRTVQVFLDKEGNLQLSPPAYFLEWKKKNHLA